MWMMRTLRWRRPVLLAALAMAGLAISLAASQGAEARTPVAAGSRLWLRVYGGAANTDAFASAIAVSPKTGTVFITGTTEPVDAGADYATVAYDPATGHRLWAAFYNGAKDQPSGASAIAVSPGGTTVFVTGSSFGLNDRTDFATVAYNAATGAQLWVERYSGPQLTRATSLVVSHDGKAVYVTGSSRLATGVSSNYVTIGYDAATGGRLWLSRYASPYSGPAAHKDQASSIAISADDKTVFVTGTSISNVTKYDYATVAYNAATGAKRWVARYSGKANRNDFATNVKVGPGGKVVYVTGASTGKTSGFDYATVAYQASTGAQLWVRRYNGPGNGLDGAAALAVTPNGGTVVVTGATSAGGVSMTYATIAYNARTGAARWIRRYAGMPGGSSFDQPAAEVISPDGRTVYVTGQSNGKGSGFDFATVAYSTATGAQQWVMRYDDPQHGWDNATGLALSPSGKALYVTGDSSTPGSSGDYEITTIGYRA